MIEKGLHQRIDEPLDTFITKGRWLNKEQYGNDGISTSFIADVKVRDGRFCETFMSIMNFCKTQPRTRSSSAGWLS